jgi:hypothetical protein
MFIEYIFKGFHMSFPVSGAESRGLPSHLKLHV